MKYVNNAWKSYSTVLSETKFFVFKDVLKNMKWLFNF